MNKVLVVAAHPDDEVLGCGGSIAKHADNGCCINIIYMSDGVSSRQSSLDHETRERRHRAALEAGRILGMTSPVFFDYEDNRMDTVPLLDIVQRLEEEVRECQPEIVYTHHPGDLNIDHNITQRAVMTACRPLPNSSIGAINYFEVPSSTGWKATMFDDAFFPNYFIDISDTISRKQDALQAYIEELRDYPHARSMESVLALAKYRGASVGVHAAEAFQIARLIEK